MGALVAPTTVGALVAPPITVGALVTMVPPVEVGAIVVLVPGSTILGARVTFVEGTAEGETETEGRIEMGPLVVVTGATVGATMEEERIMSTRFRSHPPSCRGSLSRLILGNVGPVGLMGDAALRFVLLIPGLVLPRDR